MIKAILFDIDGVLIKAPYFTEQYKKDFGIEIDDESFFKNEFPAAARGEADLLDLIGPHLAEWGWKGGADELLHYWFEFESQFVDRDMLVLAHRLELAGYEIGLGTQQEHHRINYLMNVLSFKEYFKHPFYSAGLGVHKHEPAFFEKALTALGLEAAEVLHIDDSQKIVDTAKAAGLHTHLFTKQSLLEVHLRELGVTYG